MDARIVILERDSGSWPDGADDIDAFRARTPEDVERALEMNANTLWVAHNPGPLHDYIEEGRTSHWRRLLLLESVPRIRIEYLKQLFDDVVAPDDDIDLLPEQQIFAVLAEDHPEDYFIGAGYNEDDDAVVVYRGDLRALSLSTSDFEANPQAEPDPTDLEIVDFGQTLRLGDYQVPADAILMERDSEFRRRKKAERRKFDDTFGGSIRRLREQKGLNQDQIPGVSAKTVGRIERNEVENPRDETLEKLADAFDVERDRLGWH